MPKTEKKRRQNVNTKWQKKKKNKQNGEQKNGGEKVNYDSWVKERKNEAFEFYYKQQNILPTEEWEAFMECLRSDLPSSFRIIDDTLHTHYLLKYIQNLQKSGLAGTMNLHGISWYPNGLAFEIKEKRAALRKHPLLKSFHDFLVNQSECGTIFRQEKVSMIPVLFLNVTSDSYILDMCSAPGSKTAQILEEMHRQANIQNRGVKAITGVVVANDLNCDRGHMLLHRLKYLSSPSMMVTAHAAQAFPFIYNKKNKQKIFFDSVLCDVPCTSDGTLRKAENIWRTWTSSAAIGCHRLQLQILRRGLLLCKVGGRVVYSTCSLNPIENEAIIAAVLEECKGSIELLDMSHKLPALKRRPGIKTWKVEWKGRWYETYEEMMKNKEMETHKKVHKSMFPPPSDSLAASQLHKCMRFMPHDLDAGAFFVAVLEKRSACPYEKNSTHEKEIATQSQGEEQEEEEEIGGENDAAEDMGEEEEEEEKEEEKEEEEKEEEKQQEKEEKEKEEDEETEGDKKDKNKEKKGEKNDGISTTDEKKKCRGNTQGQESCIQNNRNRKFGRRCDLTQNDFLCLDKLQDTSGSLNGKKLWTFLSSLYDIYTGGSDIQTNSKDNHICEQNAKNVEKEEKKENVKNICNGEKKVIEEKMEEKNNCSYIKELNGKKEKINEDDDDEMLKYFYIRLPVTDNEVPRKLWLATTGVYELMTGVGRTAYKVLNVGCMCFEAKKGGKYRLTHGGAKLLMKFMKIPQINITQNSYATLPSPPLPHVNSPSLLYHNGDTEAGETTVETPEKELKKEKQENQEEELKKEKQEKEEKELKEEKQEKQKKKDELKGKEEGQDKKSRLVHKVSASTLLELMALNESPPRVSIDLLSTQAQTELALLADECANLLIVSTIYDTLVPVPCWKGVRNVELMVANATRYALKCLMEDTINSEQNLQLTDGADQGNM